MMMLVAAFYGSRPIPPVHCDERWTASLEPQSAQSNAQTAFAECVPAVCTSRLGNDARKRCPIRDLVLLAPQRCLGGSGNASLETPDSASRRLGHRPDALGHLLQAVLLGRPPSTPREALARVRGP